MEIRVKEEYGQIYLDELKLSNRAFNMLKRSGVNTLLDLIKCEENGLSNIRGLGTQTINEISNILNNLEDIEFCHEDETEVGIGVVELPETVLSRPISDLRISVRIFNALHTGRIQTVGEMLALKPDEMRHLRNLGAKSYEELMDVVQSIKNMGEAYFESEQDFRSVDDYPKKEFDIEVIRILQENYAFRTNWLCDWFKITRQRVDQKIKRKRNPGCWRGREFLDEEVSIVIAMVKSHCFMKSEGRKSYYFLNNKKDDCAAIVVGDDEIKCFFKDYFPDELKSVTLKERMHQLSEAEFSDWAKGEKIIVLKETYFNAYDPMHFRHLASLRNMTLDEYSMFLYGMPYISGQHSVTDDRIINFMESNMVDGRVYIPATPETQWIRSFISRSGYSVDDFIKFYGYNTALEVDEQIEESSFGIVEKDMQVYECDGKYIEKVFARNPLIGNEIISEKNLQALYANTKNYIDKKVNDSNIQFKLAHDMQITLAVINYAKKWVTEDDSGFWRYITTQFGYRDESGKVREIICACVKNAMVRNHRWFVVSNSGYQYKSTIVIHALTTKRSWMALCDFLFEFYKTNLDMEYIENDPIIERMVEAIANKLSAADESNIDDIEISNKVYWFQEGIKKLIIHKPRYAAQFLSHMLHRIDLLVNHEEKTAKTYAEQLCDEWMEQKLSNLLALGRTRHTGERRTIAIDYSRIKAIYQLKNEKDVIIVIPDVRLEKSDFNEIRLFVYNNDKIIVDGRSMSFYGNELGKTLSGITLKLCDLQQYDSDKIFAFKVVIKCDDIEIYNSGASLYRDCLCFDGVRECGIENCSRGAYSVFIPTGQAIEFANAEVSPILADANVMAYYVRLYADFSINIKGKLLAFDNTEDNDIKVMMPRSRTDAEFMQNGIRYNIMEKDINVHIICGSSFSNKQYRIVLNGKSIDIGALENEIINGKTIYKLFIEKNIDYIFTLQIIDLMRNRIIMRRNFIVLEKLYVKFNREFYFSDMDYEHALLNIQINDMGMKACPFSKEDTAVSLPYKDGEIEIRLPIVKVRDNYNNEWNGNNRYWVKDIKQNHLVYIKTPSFLNAVILVAGNEVAIESGDTYTLGNAVFGLDNTQGTKWAEIKMLIYKNGERLREYMLGKIALVEQFAESLKLSYENGILKWDTHNHFYGDSTGNMMIGIKAEQGEEIKLPLDLNKEIIADEVKLPLGEYKYEILKQSANIFSTSNTLLGQGIFYVGDANELRFMNKRIVIDKITCEENNQLEVIHIKKTYIDNIKYLGTEFVPCEDQVCPIYSGTMFFISDTKRKRKEYSYCDGESGKGYMVYKVNPIRIVYINDGTLSLTNEYEQGIYYYKYYDRELEEIVFQITDREPNARTQSRYYLGDLYSYTKEGVDSDNV